MTHEHWFWSLLMLAVILWYSTMTFYVAVRGARDIRAMLRRLEDRKEEGPHRIIRGSEQKE